MFIFYTNCHILFSVNTQNLIIYRFASLFQILEELGLDLSFKITFADSKNSLNDKVKNLNNYLIISNKKNSNIGNQFIDPKKRVFVAYIGISILIAFLWFVLLRKYSFFAAFKKVFDKKIFFS